MLETSKQILNRILGWHLTQEFSILSQPVDPFLDKKTQGTGVQGTVLLKDLRKT